METDKQLQDSIAKLGNTLKIRCNTNKLYLYINGVVDGKRYQNVASYKQQPKEEALAKLTKKQQELIKELTTDYN